MLFHSPEYIEENRSKHLFTSGYMLKLAIRVGFSQQKRETDCHDFIFILKTWSA